MDPPTYRERAYVIQALKGLGLITLTSTERESNKLIRTYRDSVCGIELKDRVLISHFSQKHDEYQIIRKLLRIWSLIDSGPVVVVEDLQVQLREMEISEKRYFCECGRSYSSTANLAFHRRTKGHKKLSLESVIEAQ